VWSPDGNEIAFLRDIDTSRVAIHVAPVLGSADHVVAEVLSPQHDRPSLDWSPDGRWFATFERRSIVLISRTSGEKRTLTNPPGGTFGDSSPRFSPDGQYVAFRRSTGMAVDDLYVVPATGGEPRRVSFDQRGTTSLTWSADGASLIASSKRAGFIAALWSFLLRGGPPRRLTPTNADCIQPAVSRHGDKLAYVQLTYDVNTWSAPVDGSARPRPLLDSTLVDSNPQFSPDGRLIAFRSSRSGTDEVWIADRDGRNSRRLTHSNGALTGSPRWSPDGQRIVYESRISGSAQIYLMDSDGSRQIRLTIDSSNNSIPTWSHDRKYIYFTSDRTGAWQIWRQPADGGPAAQITSHGGFAGWESKDGRHLYFARNDIPGLWYIDLRTPAEQEHLVTNDLDKTMWGNWALASHGIYYIAARSLRYLPFNGAPRDILQLTAPPAAMDSGLALSPDERTVLFCQVDRMGSDIILVDPFK
jgi:Tol biopolymer transport system component